MRLLLIALFFITLVVSTVKAQSLARETLTVFGPVRTIRYDIIQGPRDFYEVASYDAKGNLMERAIYTYDDILIGKVAYLRSGGKLSETKYYRPDSSLASREVYCYDSEGRVSEIAYYDNDALDYRYIYKWNAQGNRAQVKRLSSTGDHVLIMNAVSKYDDRGNIVESVFYNLDGKVGMKEAYKYDVKGNPIKGYIKSSDGLTTEIYTYKFDRYGNVIRSTLKRVNNGKLDSVEVIQASIIYNGK